ncbi:hypothetical protein [Leptolyngbya phage Lbo-JY46]
MSFFSKVRESIARNKQIVESGNHVGIPMPFKRLADYVPLIDRGQSIGLLSGTGIGKSRFARYLFIYHIYNFYKQTGYKVKILFFPLEDSKTKVYKNIICNYLYTVHNVLISPLELDSKKSRALPDFVLDLINEAEEYFKEFEEVVTLIDGIHTPEGIYEFCEKFALQNGTVENYEVHTGKGVIKQSRYISDTHTVVVIDNMSNLDSDDERAAMRRLAKDYVRERLCNFFDFTVLQIIQQDFATERQQFTNTGGVIISKLEPSLASIGEAKTISRSMHLILSLFSPDRYDILSYPKPPKDKPEMCYDIGILGDRFRLLKVIKNNDGEVGIRVPLLMNAVQETFEELPPFNTPEINAIYKKLKRTPLKVNDSKPLKGIESPNEDELPF